MPGDNVYRVECSSALAGDAVAWMTGFDPDIAATVLDDAVELRSLDRTAEALAIAWACALANERLHVTNRQPRAAVLEGLLR